MLKRIIIPGAVALLSVGLADARPLITSPSQSVSTAPGNVGAVQACEVQLKRLAGSVKTLADNYNAERVHDECVASTREALASR